MDSLIEITDRDKLIEICNSGKYDIPNIDTTHEFVDGMYIRTMLAPQDSLLVGAKHKKDCYEILLSGILIVNNGGEKIEMIAPYCLTTKAGSAKVGYCATDVVYMNIYRTDLTNIDEIEEELFADKIYKKKELECQG